MIHQRVVTHKNRVKRVKVTRKKKKIRDLIEEKNDTLDLLADTSNALNDVLVHLSTLSTPNIVKYKLRQSEIQNIVNENI